MRFTTSLADLQKLHRSTCKCTCYIGCGEGSRDECPEHGRIYA